MMSCITGEGPASSTSLLLPLLLLATALQSVVWPILELGITLPKSLGEGQSQPQILHQEDTHPPQLGPYPDPSSPLGPLTSRSLFSSGQLLVFFSVCQLPAPFP